MKKSLTGKLTRVAVSSDCKHVIFMLEGSPTVYRLREDGLKYPDLKKTPAIELASPGDEVEIEYWERESRESNGEVASWENKTLGMSCGVPDRL